MSGITIRRDGDGSVRHTTASFSQERHAIGCDRLEVNSSMPLQINPHPSALTWRFYRELKEDPDGDGFAANTGWSLRTMNIAVTQTPEGETRIKSLIVSVSIDRRASWVVK